MSIMVPIILLPLCLLLIGLAFPMINGTVSRNTTYGFRTRKTLSNDQIWYQANKFCGKAISISVCISFVLLMIIIIYGLRNPRVELDYWAVASLSVPLIIALIASYIYLGQI